MKALITCLIAMLVLPLCGASPMPNLIAPGMKLHAVEELMIGATSKQVGSLDGEISFMQRRGMVAVHMAGDSVKSVQYTWDKATSGPPLFDLFVSLRDYVTKQGDNHSVALRINGVVLLGDEQLIGSRLGDILILQSFRRDIFFQLTLVSPHMGHAKDEASFLILEIGKTHCPVPDFRSRTGGAK